MIIMPLYQLFFKAFFKKSVIIVGGYDAIVDKRTGMDYSLKRY